VPLDDLKAYLRVDHDAEDPLITALEASAVGYLDGWRGVLGRCLLPQVWRQEFSAGDFPRLAMPDVSAVTVLAYDAEGEAMTVTAVVKPDVAGPYLEIDGSYDRAVVDYTCGMPAPQLDAARMAIRFLCAHWYRNREAVAGPLAEVPLTVEMLIAPLRWRFC
jgi:uncharacterized phiE125 gp8 family phage protein